VLVDTEDPSSGRVISAEGAWHFSHATFSPDSQRIVYVARQGDSESTYLYGVALHGGAPGAPYPLVRGTEEEQAVYVTGPELFVWMHGSRYAYFLAIEPHAGHLADTTGCSGRRTAFESPSGEPLHQNSIVAAPNARRAAFFADDSGSGNNDLFVADIDAEGNWGAATRVSERGGDSGEREVTFLNPDWLLYYEGDAERRTAHRGGEGADAGQERRERERGARGRVDEGRVRGERGREARPGEGREGDGYVLRWERDRRAKAAERPRARAEAAPRIHGWDG